MDKIAIFFSDFLNSSETFLYQRIINFKRFKPVVLSYKVSNQDIFPYSPIYSFHSEKSIIGRLKRALNSNFGISPYFEKIAKENNIKLLQAHFAIRALEILWLSKKLNIPQVNFFHGTDLDPYTSGKKNPGKLLKLVNSTALTLTNCSNMKKDLIRLGCKEEKIYVDYAGIDLTSFNFNPKQTESGKKTTLLICGRLIWKKGIEYAIDAFDLLKNKYPLLQMNIIGDGGLKKQLQAKINKLGLNNKVRLLGAQPPKEVLKELNKSHIFLHPSLEEGGPANSIKEAMAVGLPVIASNTGGIPEIVINDLNGCLVEKRDPKQIADKVSLLIENQEMQKKFTFEGRKTVEEKFDIKKQMSKLEDIYDRIIND